MTATTYPPLRNRVRAALAEAGYPNAIVSGTADRPLVELGDGPHQVPPRVCWQAFRVSRCAETPCFECWSGALECPTGECQT